MSEFDSINERIDRLSEDVKDLQELVKREADINQFQAEHLATVVAQNARNVEKGIASLSVASFLLLVCLLGLRVETVGFSFGVPVEVAIPLLGAIVTLATLVVKDYLGRNNAKSE